MEDLTTAFASGRQPENGDWAIFFKAPADVKVNCIAAAVGRVSRDEVQVRRPPQAGQ